MNRIGKKGILLTFFVSAISYCGIEEFRPFRPGVALIAGIKGTIAQLKNEIARMESEAVGVPTLKDDLARAQQELAKVKTSLGISSLELQIAALENQLDGFAQRFFKTAQVDGVFLYNSLSVKISEIYLNPEVKRRIESLIRLKHEIAVARAKGAQDAALQVQLDRVVRFKSEIRERAEIALTDIRQLGIQINLMTLNDQRGLNLITNQIAMIRQQLNNKLRNESVQAQLKPYEDKISSIHEQIDSLLDLKFTDDRLVLIEQYKNKIQQYELLLHFLRDPGSIQSTTVTEILGENTQ